MPEYRVRWEIDIEADNPQEAAEKALAIHRKPDSIATVFDVALKISENGGLKLLPLEFETVDLNPECSLDGDEEINL